MFTYLSLIILCKQFTGQGSNAKDITYDYVDENFSSIKYKSSSERLVINGIDEDNGNYHETVLYHSAGPKTSTLDKPPISDNSEHIYEDDSFYSRLGGADPLYEDPTLSQVCFVCITCVCLLPFTMRLLSSTSCDSLRFLFIMKCLSQFRSVIAESTSLQK